MKLLPAFSFGNWVDSSFYTRQNNWIKFVKALHPSSSGQPLISLLKRMKLINLFQQQIPLLVSLLHVFNCFAPRFIRCSTSPILLKLSAMPYVIIYRLPYHEESPAPFLPRVFATISLLLHCVPPLSRVFDIDTQQSDPISES